MNLTARPLVVAHRAGNHLHLLKAAEEAGADYVEADIWSYQGALEVRHLKTMGPVPLLWDRWKLVPKGRPRLRIEALLAAAAPSTRLMLDLKGREPLLPAAIAETMAALAPGRPYAVCSQNWEMLEEFRHYEDVQVFHSIGNQTQLEVAWPLLRWHDRHAVSIHARLLSRSAVSALKEKALLVVTWPINTAEAKERVLGWGVDGFTTDSLPLLRETVAARLSAPAGLAR
jgi:glycerophosphoryl diester phosphodiesterase